jgi:hypothetical protein
LGRFNDAIRGCAFSFLDEVLFSGDRRAADAIKSLSTPTEIGTKGLPIVTCPIAINLWLASNHENAAHVEEGDARYWVLKVSECRIGDHDYFAALVGEIENGGREAFAHYLLNRDIADFVPWRHVPKNNAAKDEMIRLSINPYDARKWLDDCCHAERLIGRRKPFEKDMWGKPIVSENVEWAEWREGDEYSFAELSSAYVEWQKTVKSPAPIPTKIGNLGEVLNNAGIEMRREGGTGSRLRYLPNPQTCLEHLWIREATKEPA